MLYLLLFILAIATYIWKYYESVRNYPKGPTPLPLAGNLLMFDWKKAHLQLSELSKKYGGVFTIWLPRPFVIVTDYDVLKEAFQAKGEDFSERTGMFPDIAFMNVENGGVLFSSGNEWREQRRIAITILRDFGMGKNLMETQIQDSVTDALKYWDTLDFEKFDVRWPIQLFVSNVIAKALFNIQFHSKGMDKMQLLSDKLQEYLEAVKESKLFFVSQTWPWVTNIPYFEKLAFGGFMKAAGPIKEIVAEMAEEAIKGYDKNLEPECLAQAYYQKIETNGELSYPQMVNVCMDFFIAGIETSSTILRWSCLYLAKYQDVQNKMRKEIAENLGFERLPRMTDKAVLPYCNAVIQEVLRCANIVPMNLVHRAARDSQIGGHFIPKDTFVYGQISHILSHSSRYPNPEVFNPSRFLMSDGTTPNKEAVEHLVPFGIGKRQCAGEPLARMEIFIGLVTIVQKYKLEVHSGEEVDLEPIFGQILLPKQHFLKVSKAERM